MPLEVQCTLVHFLQGWPVLCTVLVDWDTKTILSSFELARAVPEGARLAVRLRTELDAHPPQDCQELCQLHGERYRLKLQEALTEQFGKGWQKAKHWEGLQECDRFVDQHPECHEMMQHTLHLIPGLNSQMSTKTAGSRTLP